MKEILFKSEELLIAIDSESKVIYGNATKSSVVEYLNELTPKSSEEAAKPSVVKTAEDALRIADKFGLKAEVQRELDNGATPLDALCNLYYLFRDSIVIYNSYSSVSDLRNIVRNQTNNSIYVNR